MTFIYDKLKSAKRVCIILNNGNNGIGDLIEFGRMFVALDKFFYSINPTIKIDIIVPDIMENLYKSIDMKCLDRIKSNKYLKDDKSYEYIKIDDKTFNFDYSGVNDSNLNSFEIVDFAKQSDVIIDLSVEYSSSYHTNILLPLILYSIDNNQLLFYGIKNLLTRFNYKNKFNNLLIKSNYINDSYRDLLKIYTNINILTERIYKSLPISSYVQKIIDKTTKTKKLITILPTSTNHFRKYKLESWQKIINTLSNEDKYHFIILGGSKYSHLSIIDSHERIESNALIDGLSDKAKASTYNLTGELELEESISIIGNFSDYCITNDNGLAHASVLYKIPTLMLSIGSFSYETDKEAYDILDIYKRFGYKCDWLEILAGNPKYNWITYNRFGNIIKVLRRIVFTDNIHIDIHKYLYEEIAIDMRHIIKENLDQNISKRLLHSIPPERVIETFLTKIVPLKRD